MTGQCRLDLLGASPIGGEAKVLRNWGEPCQGRTIEVGRSRQLSQLLELSAGFLFLANLVKNFHESRLRTDLVGTFLRIIAGHPFGVIIIAGVQLSARNEVKVGTGRVVGQPRQGEMARSKPDS